MLNASWLLYTKQTLGEINRRSSQLEVIRNAADNRGMSYEFLHYGDNIELVVHGDYINLMQFVTSAWHMDIPPYIVNVPEGQSLFFVQIALKDTEIDIHTI